MIILHMFFSNSLFKVATSDFQKLTELFISIINHLIVFIFQFITTINYFHSLVKIVVHRNE